MPCGDVSEGDDIVNLLSISVNALPPISMSPALQEFNAAIEQLKAATSKLFGFGMQQNKFSLAPEY